MASQSGSSYEDYANSSFGGYPYNGGGDQVRKGLGPARRTSGLGGIRPQPSFSSEPASGSSDPGYNEAATQTFGGLTNPTPQSANVTSPSTPATGGNGTMGKTGGLSRPAPRFGMAR